MATEKKSAHDHDHDHDHGEDDGEVHAHVGSYRTYITVFFGLLFFTALTVGVSYVHLGRANLAVAVIIASIKAALVCVMFMHLKDDKKFNSLILVAAVTFIGVFFALTMNDTNYRMKLDTQSGARSDLRAGGDAPGAWENPIKEEPKEATPAEHH